MVTLYCVENKKCEIQRKMNNKKKADSQSVWNCLSDADTYVQLFDFFKD